MALARREPLLNLTGLGPGHLRCPDCGDRHICSSSLRARGGYDELTCFPRHFGGLEDDPLGIPGRGARRYPGGIFGGWRRHQGDFPYPECVWNKIHRNYRDAFGGTRLHEHLRDMIERIDRFISRDLPYGHYSHDMLHEIRHTLAKVAKEITHQAQDRPFDNNEYHDIADRILEMRQGLGAMGGVRHVLPPRKRHAFLRDVDMYDGLGPFRERYHAPPHEYLPPRRRLAMMGPPGYLR